MTIFDQVRQAAKQAAQQRQETYESVQQARREELQAHARSADDFLDRRKRKVRELIMGAAHQLPPVEWLTMQEAYALTGYELHHLQRLINLGQVQGKTDAHGLLMVNTESLRSFLLRVT